MQGGEFFRPHHAAAADTTKAQVVPAPSLTENSSSSASSSSVASSSEHHHFYNNNMNQQQQYVIPASSAQSMSSCCSGSVASSASTSDTASSPPAHAAAPQFTQQQTIIHSNNSSSPMKLRTATSPASATTTSPILEKAAAPANLVISTTPVIQNPFEDPHLVSSATATAASPRNYELEIAMMNPPESPTRSIAASSMSVPTSPSSSIGTTPTLTFAPAGGGPATPDPTAGLVDFLPNQQQLMVNTTGGGGTPVQSAATTPTSQQATTTAPVQLVSSVPPQPRFVVEDSDENTEPSSSAIRSEDSYSAVPVPPDASVMAGSFTRLLEQTRKRFTTPESSSSNPAAGEPEIVTDPAAAAVGEEVLAVNSNSGALICGYLHKLGRNGKWQTRWFETDGECLSYYKSSKRSKLLATLDLEKVGRIALDPEDTKGCSFGIQVLGRMYNLRADSKAAAKDWVITLNRVKEARLQQGNVKLQQPLSYQQQQQPSQPQQPIDLLDLNPVQKEEVVATTTPGVVVVANRQRTRAVDESQEWDQMMIRSGTNTATTTIATGTVSGAAGGVAGEGSALGNAVLARWSKRHSSLNRLGAKLAKWARSITKYRCTEIEEHQVYLDRHVHPPGHDDNLLKFSSSHQPGIADDAVATAAAVAKPSRARRALSTSSDDLRVIS